MRKKAIKPRIRSARRPLNPKISSRKKKSYNYIPSIIKLLKHCITISAVLFAINSVIPLRTLYSDMIGFSRFLYCDYFTVKNIEIRGNLRLSNKQILDHINLSLADLSQNIPYTHNEAGEEKSDYNFKCGRNNKIWNISPYHIKSSLEEFNVVKSVKVRIILPSTIDIEINERIPKAIWWHGGKFFLIDVDGNVLQEQFIPLPTDYIIVVGDEANATFIQALKIIDETQFKDQISSLQFIGKRRWNILLKNGLMVKLPENDIKKAASLFDSKLKDYILKHGDVKCLDLRLAPERIFLKFNKVKSVGN